MQPDAKASAHDAAIAWLLRLRDGDSSDWEAFTLWLEADAAHAVAYDMVMLADADLDILTMASASSIAANDDDPPVPRRLGRWAAAVAVAAAAVAGITLIRPTSSPVPAREVWTTAAGERREMALGDGSRVAMNGGTILVLDRTDARRVELRTGEALFTVRHSLVRPFTVVTGTDSIVDTGTVFNIARDAGHLRVAVARGSVRFNPDAENIGLVAGGILTRMPNGRLLRAQGNPSAAGSWRVGRLEFDDWPLAAVAVDLARNTGLRISVDPAIARQKFSGTVLLDVDPARTVARVAGLAGVTARYERGVWRLAPGQRPAR